MAPRELCRDDVQRLYEAHARVLFAYGRSLVGEAAVAEDLLHQVFARLLQGDIAVDGLPLAYLCRAVRNAAFNHRRTAARETSFEAHETWLEAPAGTTDTGLALEQAMTTLPAEQREVLLLHVWGDLTFREIAEILDLPANTVASRYRYALAKLRRVLTPLG